MKAGHTNRRPHSALEWYKPLNSTIKINVDGAYSTSSNVIVIEIVARDNHGMVVGGMCWQIPYTFTVGSAKVKAFTQGIKFALEIGWNIAIIEGDTISIINSLTNQSDTDGLLLNEARGFLASNNGLKYFINREVNKVAYNLTQFAF
ncbi:uncharacterized protein LOC120121760 [Hibiscus syriacus]|uniref:uncharacterized protein LOC120121760 n=1 Tax=Hibiscus syriacus TaxID=106335 RepID=UPI0019226FAF|nr:uncharacterized protein LOC120121760 [Hibiscus syriacus]